MPARGRSSLCALLASAALALMSPSAQAQTSAAKPEPGLPMWVVRDADSTIYITGTVHVLPDNVNWRSAKLDAALGEATELWLEIAEAADPDGLMHAVMTQFGDRLAHAGPSLFSQLTPKDRELLDAAIADMKTPPDVVAKMDTLLPWYTVLALERTHRTSGGYRSRNGIDVTLGAMARAQGDEVKGLETLEFQLGEVFEASFDDQLVELRERLRDPPGGDHVSRAADLAHIGWTRGETNMVEALLAMAMMASPNGMDFLLRDRNIAWAERIDEMLDGSGVSLIAVGAMHLVGPDSLQRQLKRRGIDAQRY